MSKHIGQAHPQRSPLIRWLSSTISIQMLGSKDIPSTSTVVVIRRGQKWLLDTVYESVFAGHADFNTYAVIDVPQNKAQASITLSEALDLARSKSGVVLPLALMGRPVATLPFTGVKIPLPRARIVIVMQAPFEIPRQPEEIPDAWPQAIHHLLAQANGLAADHLATWIRQTT